MLKSFIRPEFLTGNLSGQTLAQLVQPAFQWTGAPNILVRILGNSKQYRWAGQVNTNKILYTGPPNNPINSTIRNEVINKPGGVNTIKAQLRPIYASSNTVNLEALCNDLNTKMNMYGN